MAAFVKQVIYCDTEKDYGYCEEHIWFDMTVAIGEIHEELLKEGWRVEATNRPEFRHYCPDCNEANK